MEVSSVSTGDMMAAMQPMKPPSSSDMADMTVQEKDSDGDGLLTATELGISSDTFAQMDTDGDGGVSSSELSSKISEQLSLVSEDGEEPDMNEIKSALAEIGVSVPDGPPGPPPAGGPVEEEDETEETEETTAIAGAESTAETEAEEATGTELISQALNQMDLTEEEKAEAMEAMSASTLDMVA